MDPRICVQIVDYNSPESLIATLKGQDALVITMANTAPIEQQLKLVDAAAAADVQWVLPNEWGSDTDHPYNLRTGIYDGKLAVRTRIEQLGKSAWIAVVSNQWYEMSLSTNRYGIDIKRRTATLFDKGYTRTTTTTKAQVGRAVARLLSLPVNGGSPSLSDYANKYVYIKSFFLNQIEMLEAVQRNTGTSATDWNITNVDLKQRLNGAYQEFQNGNRAAMLDWISLSNFAPESGNDFAVSRKTANEALNLQPEDLDEATKRAIEQAERLNSHE